MNTSGNPQSNVKRIHWLDTARGIAALSVLFHHYMFFYIPRAVGEASRFLYGQVDFGRVGVALFFAVSGYIIPKTLWNYKKLAVPTWQFMVRRFFRLYPAYIVSLLLAIAMGSYGWMRVLAHLTMVQEFFGQKNIVGVYWTLHAEIAFYCICAVLYAYGIIACRWSARICFYLSILLSLLMATAGCLLHRDLPVNLPSALSVMFLAYMLLQKEEGFIGNSVTILHVLGFGVTIFIVSYIAYGTVPSKSGWTWNAISYSIGFGVFLVLLEKKIALRSFSFVGDMSYSIYLFHWLVVKFFAGEREVISGAQLLLSICTTFLIAFLSYRLLERPFITIGNNIIERFASGRAVASDAAPRNLP